MITQLTLGLESKLYEQFETYHRENPQVYNTLVRLARQMQERGYTRIGIKMLFEVVRYEMMMQTRDDDGWKLNNNYTSRYARLIMQRNPDLAGVFETRELKS